MPPSSPQSDANSAAQPRLWALIPCAGNGSRSGAAGPKQYEKLAGRPLVMHTLAAFAGVVRLSGTLVVVSPGDTFFAGRAVSARVAACGGETRAQSVANGLQALSEGGAGANDWVLVHDAARCLITTDEINTLIEACLRDPVGGLLALPLPDTLKQAHQGRVSSTLTRVDKWLAQTPQMFRLAELQAALHSAGEAVTDESSAMEATGKSPLLVQGSAQNFKVTYAQDFALAERILQSRSAVQPTSV